MKIVKTKENEYTWFIKATLRKDGYITLEKRRSDGEFRDNWQWFQCDVRELEEIIKELRKNETNE